MERCPPSPVRGRRRCGVSATPAHTRSLSSGSKRRRRHVRQLRPAHKFLLGTLRAQDLPVPWFIRQVPVTPLRLPPFLATPKRSPPTGLASARRHTPAPPPYHRHFPTSAAAHCPPTHAFHPMTIEHLSAARAGSRCTRRRPGSGGDHPFESPGLPKPMAVRRCAGGKDLL